MQTHNGLHIYYILLVGITNDLNLSLDDKLIKNKKQYKKRTKYQYKFEYENVYE